MVRRAFALLADVTDLRNRAARALGRVSFEEASVGDLPARLFRPPENGGEPAGVVFCPAWLVDHRLYTRLCLGLAAAGYHVLAFDFLGEGRAPGTTRTSWDTFIDGRMFYHRRNAENARAALDALESVVEGGPLALMGHSRGGYQAATVRDDRVKARVSIQPFNWILPPASTFVLPLEKRVHPNTLFISGDLDLVLAPNYFNDLPMYRAADPPKAWLSIIGSEHLLPISDLPSVPHWTKDLILHYATAWLDYLLRGDSGRAREMVRSRPGVSLLIAHLHELGLDTRQVLGVEIPRCAPR
ncbi:MAG: alpha/beta fold hydrolase [Halobacteria archaeon]